MLKTARRILKEKHLDFDKIKAGPKDTNEYRTVALIEFISEWIEKRPIGERLTILKRRAGEIRNEANPETIRGFLYKTPNNYQEGSWHNPYYMIVYDPDKINDPLSLLVALGYEVWTYAGYTYVGLVRKNS